MCSDHERVLDRQIPRWTVDLTKGMTSPEMDKLVTGREKFRRRRLLAKKKKRKVRISGKGKCKLIANFSAKMVTSLPSASVSLSLSLFLSHRAHLTRNIGSAGPISSQPFFFRYQHVFDSFCQIHVDIEKKKKKKKKKRHGQVCQARVVRGRP